MAGRQCCIGIDIGGTKIAAGIVEFPSGTILKRVVIPTLPQRGSKAVLDDCLSLARDLSNEAKQMTCHLHGIGVVVPELVDLQGNVTSHYTLHWCDIPVQALFSQIAPSVVESDVRAGAVGEALFGAGRDFRIFVYLTIGTGISHTLMLDGKPFAGARGNALTCASSPLTTICDYCGRRLEPILDYYAAGPAMLQRYNQKSPRKVLDTRELFALAEGEDPLAREIVKSAGEAVGVTLGFLVNVLDPEAVIIGGGIGSHSKGVFWESLVASTRHHIWADNARDLPIIPAALGPDSGLIGAAVMVAQRFAPNVLPATSQPIHR